MAHTMAPLVIIASGLALVVFTGKLDISVGSIAFLSSAVAVLLMHDAGVGAPLAFLAALVTGALLGALNGFVVVVLGINSLIATLGSMIALRGVALQLTNAILIPLPESVRGLGNATIGGVFVDVIVAAVIMVILHVLHRRTVFGRRLDAIGNGEDNAVRIGIPVPQTVFLSFVASGFLASVGGLIGLLQVGAISAYLGKGMEFTAVAAMSIVKHEGWSVPSHHAPVWVSLRDEPDHRSASLRRAISQRGGHHGDSSAENAATDPSDGRRDRTEKQCGKR